MCADIEQQSCYTGDLSDLQSSGHYLETQKTNSDSLGSKEVMGEMRQALAKRR